MSHRHESIPEGRRAGRGSAGKRDESASASQGIFPADLEALVEGRQPRRAASPRSAGTDATRLHARPRSHGTPAADHARAASAPKGGVRGDAAWDADWEAATVDASWATGGAAAATGYSDGALARSLTALGAVGAPPAPSARPARLARLRGAVRRGPAATLMLLVFLLGFVLTCVAPLIPLLRLSYDAVDAMRRVSHLQTVLQGGKQQLLKSATLSDVQSNVDAIAQDLYELNAAANVIGAPLAAVSPTARNYRLLVRIGYDLSTAARESVQVGQTLLAPLQGGALASESGAGITPDDIQQARSVLADTRIRVVDALAAYRSLDPHALPALVRPGTKDAALLAQLPLALSALDEAQALLDVAPSLLGIGQPANYLVIAMDRTELRPGGGFQGNYGILTLSGGKQPANQPLGLRDTYELDQKYYQKSISADLSACDDSTGSVAPPYDGPQPPAVYWWWPIRNFSCHWDWGLRDANLSPDFPTNARMAMDIAQAAGEVPNQSNLQGVVAFTPALVESVLRIPGVGPISLPQYPKDPPVTADNVEELIHCHQLGICSGPVGQEKAPRKEFSHLLSQAMLARIKQLPHEMLAHVAEVGLRAMQTKDLEVYLADPRAEMMLQQIGLAAQIHTGAGDGFFVVDTNDGGNKANTYVTEQYADLVTLLPDGGAVHRLEITVTYDKQGTVYSDVNTPDDYNAVQRVYMPGDASILGYTGFALPGGGGTVPAPITGCSAADNFAHCLSAPVTTSDVAGRTMVMGLVDVACAVYDDGSPHYSLPPSAGGCKTAHVNHQVIDVEWYTPHAWTPSGNGHGTYTELVEKQAGTQGIHGSTVTLSVYLDTSQLSSTDAIRTDWTDATLRVAALGGARQIFAQSLESDQTIAANF